MEETLINLIGNLGFPIAITVYVLIRLEGKMDKLETAINQLSTSIKNQ